MDIYDFKAAVHLNNVGVTLLQRQCYRQAVEILNDSILVMKMASRRSPTHDSDGSSNNSTDDLLNIPEKLQHAAIVLSNPKPESCVAHQQKKVILRVISDDEDPIRIGSSFCSHQSQHNDSSDTNTTNPNQDISTDNVNVDSKVVYIVRMEPVGLGGGGGSTEKLGAVESSIVLYNHGIALQCLSLSMSGRPQATTSKIDQGSFYISQLAFTTLSSRDTLEKLCMSDKLNRFLLANVLSLGQLIKLSQQLGMPEKHIEYCRYLDTLQDSMQSLGSFGIRISSISASAA